LNFEGRMKNSKIIDISIILSMFICIAKI